MGDGIHGQGGHACVKRWGHMCKEPVRGGVQGEVCAGDLSPQPGPAKAMDWHWAMDRRPLLYGTGMVQKGIMASHITTEHC